MVPAPNLANTDQLFLDASLEIARGYGEETLSGFGFTSDHFDSQSLDVVCSYAAILPTILREVSLNESSHSSQAERWNKWRSFLTQFGHSSSSEMKDQPKPSSFENPSDISMAISHFHNLGMIDSADLFRLGDAVERLFSSSVPGRLSEWMEWLSDLYGGMFRTCQQVFGLEEGSLEEFSRAMAIGRGFLELPKIVSACNEHRMSTGSSPAVPAQLMATYGLDTRFPFFEAENVSESHMGVVRRLALIAIESLSSAEVLQHPESEKDCFINFVQWSESTMDQLQFIYQNPEAYFFPQSAALSF